MGPREGGKKEDRREMRREKGGGYPMA